MVLGWRGEERGFSLGLGFGVYLGFIVRVEGLGFWV